MEVEMANESDIYIYIYIYIYRVIKKSLCTWGLQYKKHAKMQYFKENTFGIWTVLYWTRSSRTQFGVSINVWRLPGATLNIICNFLYCNHQVHRDFLITLYYCYMPKISSEIFLFWIFIFRTLCLREQGRVDSWLFFEAEWGPRAKRLGNTGIDVIMVWFTFVLGGGYESTLLMPFKGRISFSSATWIAIIIQAEQPGNRCSIPGGDFLSPGLAVSRP